MKSFHLQQHGWISRDYVKWSKSVKEIQILYDLSNIQNLKQTKKEHFTDTENELIVARGKEGLEGGRNE